MMCMKRKNDETIGEFVYRQNKQAKMELKKNGTLMSEIALRKQWRYVGHCVRNPLPEMQQLLFMRDASWWDQQNQTRHRMVRLRTCG
eukprot:11285640-Karenia_brevis.AAC.1